MSGITLKQAEQAYNDTLHAAGMRSGLDVVVLLSALTEQTQKQLMGSIIQAGKEKKHVVAAKHAPLIKRKLPVQCVNKQQIRHKWIP